MSKTPGGYGTYTQATPMYDGKIGDIAMNQIRFIQQMYGEQEANRRKAEIEYAKQRGENSKLFVLKPEEVSGYFKKEYTDIINNSYIPKLAELNEFYNDTQNPIYLQKAQAIQNSALQLGKFGSTYGNGYLKLAEALGSDKDYSPELNAEYEAELQSLYEGNAKLIDDDNNPTTLPKIVWMKKSKDNDGKDIEEQQVEDIDAFTARMNAMVPQKKTYIEDKLDEYAKNLKSKTSTDTGFNKTERQTWELNLPQAEDFINNISGTDYQRPSKELLDFNRKTTGNIFWKPKNEEDFKIGKQRMLENIKSKFVTETSREDDPQMSLKIANQKADLENTNARTKNTKANTRKTNAETKVIEEQTEVFSSELIKSKVYDGTQRDRFGKIIPKGTKEEQIEFSYKNRQGIPLDLAKITIPNKKNAFSSNDKEETNQEEVVRISRITSNNGVKSYRVLTNEGKWINPSLAQTSEVSNFIKKRPEMLKEVEDFKSKNKEYNPFEFLMYYQDKQKVTNSKRVKK